MSHHHMLWMELELPHTAPAPPAPLLTPLRVPNLRDLSAHQKRMIGMKLTEKLEEAEKELRAGIVEASTASLSYVASSLTSIVRRLAFVRLPLTGATPGHSRCILQLQRQRHALTRLLRTSELLLAAAPAELRGHCHCLTRSPEWTHMHLHCTQQLELRWTTDVHYAGDARLWLDETRELLRVTDRHRRQEQKRMLRETKPPLDADPAALVHRMLQSDALPEQLLSVVDSRGQLTSSPAQLEDVMVAHFTSVFAVPPPSDAPLPHAVPAVLLDKPEVERSWFDG